jgi:DNA helicase IV
VSADVLELGEGGTHQARYERDVKLHHTVRRLAGLADAESGLCFGRIDRQDGERLYIGRLAIADEDNEPILVDWRAPAAAPFYRATARQPMGLVRRRHFLVRGRRLVGIEDDLLAGEPEHGRLVLVGEAALLASLERSRTGRMADIVATIQREQDEIIRSPLAGILVVQGGPGTGKTAVALHRAAYLLYTYRFPLERGGVLLVGPNRVFLRYIERVLPSLGEHTVAFATPSSLLPAVTVSATDAPEAARVKGDARMAQVVARAVAQRERGLPHPATVFVGTHRLTLTPAASRRIAEQARKGRGGHNERRARVERAVLRDLARQWKRQVGSQATDEEWRHHARRLRRDPVLVAALERMWPVLTPEALLDDLFGVPALLQAAATGVLAEHEWRALHRPRSPSLGAVAWTEADVALLDEAAAGLGPVPARARPAPAPEEDERWMVERVLEDAGGIDPVMRADLVAHLSRWTAAARPGDGGDGDDGPEGIRTFSHVIVDEAQDLSPMQLRALARRCPSGSMTVVGDLGQASRARASSWDDVLAHLPHRRPPRVTELSVNYRTPAEVMEVAARVLAAGDPGLAPPRSARTTGLAPAFTQAAPEDLVEVAAGIARSEHAEVGDGRTAVICPRALVGPLEAALGLPPPDAGLLDHPLTVLPLDLAKGLEFDAVVVVEPAGLVDEAPNGLRALYVAVTRTTRRLHVVHARELPGPLAGAAASAIMVR